MCVGVMPALYYHTGARKGHLIIYKGCGSLSTTTPKWLFMEKVGSEGEPW